MRIPNAAAAPITEEEPGRLAFVYGGRRYILRLTGSFQRDNALTALEVASCLEEKGFSIPDEAKEAGLAGWSCPARQEILRRTPLLMLDGAHNPHGLAALAETLRRMPEAGSLTLLVGMLRDKNTAACAALLGPLCRHIVCCTPGGTDRALPARSWRHRCALLPRDNRGSGAWRGAGTGLGKGGRRPAADRPAPFICAGNASPAARFMTVTGFMKRCDRVRQKTPRYRRDSTGCDDKFPAHFGGQAPILLDRGFFLPFSDESGKA